MNLEAVMIEVGSEQQAQRRVAAWNRSIQVGAEVLYLKSEIEGEIVTKTVGPAYLLGTEAVVELEHLGLALLTKTGAFFR